MICVLKGAGAADRLNCRIYQQEVEPINPKEEDIWVVTTEPSAKVFFAEESFEVGPDEMCIMYESAAVEPDGVNTYYRPWNSTRGGLRTTCYMKLVSCKQYVTAPELGMNTKPRAGYIYKSGQWVQFAWPGILLYDRGNQCVNRTGGWNAIQDTTLYEDHIYMFNAGNVGQARISTVNKIDLSAASLLCVQIDSGTISYGNGFILAVRSSDTAYPFFNGYYNSWENALAIARWEGRSLSLPQVVSLPISGNLNNRVYMAVDSPDYNHAMSASVNISKVWYE